MDEKADHFPAYEKWTHLTLTDDQEDLVVLFQRIIEIMQEIVSSRTQQQVARRPKPQVRPKPKPKKQACVDVISGDELDVTKKVPGENHDGRAGESTAQSEILPGGRSEGQSSRRLSQQESGDSNVSVNITPATPQEEENKTVGSFDDDAEYARNLTFVRGTAVLKTEQCQTISDNDDDTTTVVSGLKVQEFAETSVKRETDTDDSIYQNRHIKTSELYDKTADSTTVPDLNGNLVTDSVVSATDSAAEDFDDIDGPSGLLLDHVVPYPHRRGDAQYRPRSGRVTDREMKLFRNRSAAARFTLSPSVIDGDDEREVLLVFERALRGDADLEVMLAGVPDHPPRTLHSVMSNPYNIKVIVPKLQAGRVQLRLMKKNITWGAQHLHVISHNGDMIGLSQLYLTTLNLICTSQRGITPKKQPVSESDRQRLPSGSSTDSQDDSPRVLLDRHIIHLFENNDIPVQAFEQVFSIYQEFVQRDETMNGDLPSLLHFSARYGLCELTSRLIDLPNARGVCNLRNHNGYKPIDLAELYGHHELADFLDQYSKTIDTREEIYALVREFYQRRESRKSSKSGDSGSPFARRQTSYDGTIRRSAAFKCRKNSNPSLAISLEYKRNDSTDSLPKSQSSKDSETSTESVLILMKSSVDSDTRGSDNEVNSREGSQPPTLPEEEEHYIVPDQMKSESSSEEVTKTGTKKSRSKFNQIVPPPPVACGRTRRGVDYVNAPSESTSGYVNAPGDRTDASTCPYDNSAAAPSSGWDDPVPVRTAGLTKMDSYLEPVSPDAQNYERLDSGDMVECDAIRAQQNCVILRSDSEEDQYMSMGARSSGDYMSMGGVKRSSDYMVMDDDNDGKSSQKNKDDDDYVNVADDQPVPPVIDERYLQLSDESRVACHNPEGYLKLSGEPKTTCRVPEGFITLKEPSWDDEVPLSPAYMMKQILGEELDTLPPPPCSPIPGYISMGGKEQASKKHSYVNEEVLSQQRSDRVDAYATSVSSESVPPPPFHEHSFSGKNDPSAIQHGPAIGQVTADMLKSRSQKELLDILNMVKTKEINMHEAELLFSAWQQQYNGGMTQSFRDRRDQLKMMQSEFEVARQNFGSNEKLNQQGKKSGFFSKFNLFSKNPRKKSTGDLVDGDQMKRMTRSTGSESSLTESVDGSLPDTVNTYSGQTRTLQAVKESESSRLSTASNSSSSSNGSRISCASLSSTHDSGIDELHQERNSAHLAEEVVKSDVYPKPPPVPSRNVSQHRPLPPVPDTPSSNTPAEGTPTRRGAIPTATGKRGVSSRIPSMLPHIANKAQSQEALNVSSSSRNDEHNSSSSDASKPQTLPKPKRKPGYEQVVLGLANNRMFRERKQSQSKEAVHSVQSESKC